MPTAPRTLRYHAPRHPLRGVDSRPRRMIVAHVSVNRQLICAQPRPSAVNTSLPALLLSAVLQPRAATARLPASGLSGLCQSCSNAAATGQTDRRTDTVPLHRSRLAYYAGRANEVRNAGKGLAL